MTDPLALACAALVAFEGVRLVRFWRRMGRIERRMQADWDAVLVRLDEAERRRQQGR